MNGETEEKKEEIAEEPKEDTIALKKADYDNLMQRITKLEAEKEIFATLNKNKEEEEEDEIPPSPGVEKETKFSEMTPEQFYEHILDTVGKPLMLQIMTNQVKTEIREAKREHEDFKDYEKEVEKVCMKNPNMSVEDAYIYLKAKREGIKPKEPAPSPEIKKEPLVPPKGEKPGISSSALKQGSPKTLREAIMLADKEVHKEE